MAAVKSNNPSPVAMCNFIMVVPPRRFQVYHHEHQRVPGTEWPVPQALLEVLVQFEISGSHFSGRDESGSLLTLTGLSQSDSGVTVLSKCH
jgi:hypothetical protein